MISEINQTPKALRIHIGVFGNTNAGKSTFINNVSGQDVALTSHVAGTTTDPVFKPMELQPVGPVVFIDTAGLDDTSELGKACIQKSLEQLEQCDAAVLVVSSVSGIDETLRKCVDKIKGQKLPLIVVENMIDGISSGRDYSEFCDIFVRSDLNDRLQAEKLQRAIITVLKDLTEDPVLTADLVKPSDTVLLIAPQDIQAPKGRLILPQVQVIRDLLDNGCMVLTVTTENLKNALDCLKTAPALVVTDSQVFGRVNEILPPEIPLTSFSLLMAKIKGDIDGFIRGAYAIDKLKNGDKALILESCAHHAMDDDIARIKIPAMLRKYTGKNLIIDNVSGQKVNINLSDYKLAIHCGGCMINRRAMIAKQKMFEDAGVPMTNFGICIAYMNGMLDRVCY